MDDLIKLGMGYRFFKVGEETSTREMIENFLEEFIRVRQGIADLEKHLGVVSSCLDMEIYKVAGDYYFVMVMRPGEKEEKINSDLKEISVVEFFDQIKNDFIFYGLVGTRMFNEYRLTPYLKGGQHE